MINTVFHFYEIANIEGHVNNARYLDYADAAVNYYLSTFNFSLADICASGELRA